MSASTDNERILVVDDSRDTLEVLQRNLMSAGYQVFTAPGVPTRSSEEGTFPAIHAVSPRIALALAMSVRSKCHTTLPSGRSLMISNRLLYFPSAKSIGTQPSSISPIITFLNVGQ